MDITNPEMWKQEWTAFSSAPYIILPFIVAGWLAAWWFRGRTSEGETAGLKEQIAGLKEQIATWDQRLKLATESVAAADRARDELDKQFQAYKAEVAAKGSNASPAKFAAAFEQLRREDAIMAAGIKAAQQALDAQYGAHRKLDPEILKELKDHLDEPTTIDPTKKRGMGMVPPR